MNSHGGGPPAAFFGFIMMLWCCMGTLGLGQIVLFLVAIVQILSNKVMQTDKKILWLLVCWFLPLIGPILFWTVGKKDAAGPNPPPPPPPGF